MENRNIFDDADDIRDLFAEETEVTPKGKKEPEESLFEEDELEEDEPKVKSKTKEETEDLEEEDPDNQEVKKKSGRPKKPTAYGEAILAMRKVDPEFLVYEGEEDKVDYTEEEYSEIISQNLQTRSQAIAEATIDAVLNNLSSTARKLVLGELKGVKISEIVKDLEYYTEIENIPENPTPTDKEKIVKVYYQKQAKERNKDASWVSKQLEKIIDRGDLDSEFEDAKEVIAKELDEKLELKNKEKEEEKKQKEAFKQYHRYYVNEALNEENLFGISLDKNKKKEIASVLANFAVRDRDGKEKMGLAIMVDNLIHSQTPKEAYKRLVLMTLAGVAPDELIKILKDTTETQVSKQVFKKLKIAEQPTAVTPKKETKTKQIGNIF
jgi:hypothetical protein